MMKMCMWEAGREPYAVTCCFQFEGRVKSGEVKEGEKTYVCMKQHIVVRGKALHLIKKRFTSVILLKWITWKFKHKSAATKNRWVRQA